MAHKKRIMHVVECFGGGVLQSISKLCHFMKDDAELIVVHSRREQTPEDFAKFYPEGTTFVEWEAGRSIHPVKTLKSALKLREIVEEYQPDVLHLQSSIAGGVGRIAFPFGGGMNVLYTPRAYGFLQLDMHPLKRFAYWGIEKVFGTLPHTTVACGKGEHMLAQKIARKSDVVLNSIAIERLDGIIKNPKKHKTFTVISSGRICPQKNFPMFVDVARHFADKNVNFIWVGGGDMPEGLELPSNLKLTGWMQYEDSIKEMARADVYFQPSLWEGLSLTVLESMGLGLPVVLSNAVGNKEMVEEGVDGFVCSTKDQYISAIEKLREDGSLRTAFGKAARAKIISEYNNEKCKADWKRVYGIK